MNTIYVALDLETTGFDPVNDSIIEVGAVKFSRDGQQADFSSLVYYDGQLPDTISRLTGIEQLDLISAPKWLKVRRELVKFLEDADVIVGHNIEFDLSFLKQNNVDLSHKKKMDTYYLFGMFFPDEESYSLEGLHNKYVGQFRAHRAHDDSKATMSLFEIARNQIRYLNDFTLTRIIDINRRGDWVYGEIFASEQIRRKSDQKEKNFRFRAEDEKILLAGENNFSVEDGVQFSIRDVALSDYLKNWGNRNQILAVSDRVFFMLKNILSGKYFIDAQQQYLCRKKLKKVKEKIGLRDGEIAILTKILLKIDRGFWDGYLLDLKFDKTEESYLDNFRCSCPKSNMSCFFHYRVESIKRENGKIITRIGSLDSFGSYGLKGLGLWLEDILLEDGLTYQTQAVLKQSESDQLLEKLNDCGACTLKDDGKLDQIKKKLDFLWSMLNLFVKANGTTNGYGTSLDMTPAVYQGYDFEGLRDKLDELDKLLNIFIEGRLQCCICRDKIKILLDVLSGLQGKDNRVSRLIMDEKDQIVVYSYPVFFYSWVNDLIDRFGRIDLMARNVVVDGSFYAIDFFTDQANKVDIFSSKKSKNIELIRNYGFSWDKVILKVDWSKKNLFIFSSKFKTALGMDSLMEVVDEVKLDSIFDINKIRKNYQFKSGIIVSSVFDLSYLSLKISDFDCIFLESLPFDPPGTLLIGHRAVIFGEQNFDRYYAMRMLSKINYISGLLKSDGKFYLADARLENRSYGKRVMNLFNN